MSERTIALRCNTSHGNVVYTAETHTIPLLFVNKKCSISSFRFPLPFHIWYPDGSPISVLSNKHRIRIISIGDDGSRLSCPAATAISEHRNGSQFSRRWRSVMPNYHYQFLSHTHRRLPPPTATAQFREQHRIASIEQIFGTSILFICALVGAHKYHYIYTGESLTNGRWWAREFVCNVWWAMNINESGDQPAFHMHSLLCRHAPKGD